MNDTNLNREGTVARYKAKLASAKGMVAYHQEKITDAQERIESYFVEITDLERILSVLDDGSIPTLAEAA